MSAPREVRIKINSVGKTKKITRAMQMVASSKMRKTQVRMQSSRPYAEKIVQVIAHLARAHPEYRHPLMQERPVKRAAYIVVTTDRGLCGSLNANLLRQVALDIRKKQSEGVSIEVCVAGNKADVFFKHLQIPITAKVNRLEEKTELAQLIGLVKVMLDAFASKKIDALYVAYNQFVSTMAQKPIIQQLLPIVHAEAEKKYYWDYIYEPDAKILLDRFLRRYAEMTVYHSVTENLACEQAARMMAMMSATQNADHLIQELQLEYNKARQAAITQEISEIVGGARAIE